MSVAVRQEEPCGGERLHQGARGDQDHEGPEDPGDSLRGQHRRPSRQYCDAKSTFLHPSFSKLGFTSILIVHCPLVHY